MTKRRKTATKIHALQVKFFIILMFKGNEVVTRIPDDKA